MFCGKIMQLTKRHPIKNTKLEEIMDKSHILQYPKKTITLYQLYKSKNLNLFFLKNTNIVE